MLKILPKSDTVQCVLLEDTRLIILLSRISLLSINQFVPSWGSTEHILWLHIRFTNQVQLCKSIAFNSNFPTQPHTHIHIHYTRQKFQVGGAVVPHILVLAPLNCRRSSAVLTFDPRTRWVLFDWSNLPLRWLGWQTLRSQSVNRLCQALGTYLYGASSNECRYVYQLGCALPSLPVVRPVINPPSLVPRRRWGIGLETVRTCDLNRYHVEWFVT